MNDTQEAPINSRRIENADGTEGSDKPGLTQDPSVGDPTLEEHATYFVVIADTSSNYAKLHSEMLDLSVKLHIPIDTMGRYYNTEKNLIALPDDDEDEIYAGSYYPRRFPSEHLSLEYLNFYQNNAGEKTIALVTGIFETEQSADSSLASLKMTVDNAFTLKADIYTGCMH